MIYLKYIDPKGINDNTFASTKDLETKECGVIEVVGYLVKEDEKSVTVAMQTVGDMFRKVLYIPKTSIVSGSLHPFDDIHGVKEVEFNDVMYAFSTTNVSKEKLEAMPVPSVVKTVGFVVRDDKDIALAMERNSVGNYRTIAIFPKFKSEPQELHNVYNTPKGEMKHKIAVKK